MPTDTNKTNSTARHTNLLISTKITPHTLSRHHYQSLTYRSPHNTIKHPPKLGKKTQTNKKQQISTNTTHTTLVLTWHQNRHSFHPHTAIFNHVQISTNPTTKNTITSLPIYNRKDRDKDAHLPLLASLSPETQGASLLSTTSTTTCLTTHIPTYMYRTTKSSLKAHLARHQLPLMKFDNQ